jgi:hypothetical protein
MRGLQLRSRQMCWKYSLVRQRMDFIETGYLRNNSGRSVYLRRSDAQDVEFCFPWRTDISKDASFFNDQRGTVEA